LREDRWAKLPPPSKFRNVKNIEAESDKNIENEIDF